MEESQSSTKFSFLRNGEGWGIRIPNGETTIQSENKALGVRNPGLSVGGLGMCCFEKSGGNNYEGQGVFYGKEPQTNGVLMTVSIIPIAWEGNEDPQTGKMDTSKRPLGGNVKL